MKQPYETHAAATVLLRCHDAATKKPIQDRTAIEMIVANLGRNRLKSIIAISGKSMNPQTGGDQ